MVRQGFRSLRPASRTHWKIAPGGSYRVACCKGQAGVRDLESLSWVSPPRSWRWLRSAVGPPRCPRRRPRGIGPPRRPLHRHWLPLRRARLPLRRARLPLRRARLASASPRTGLAAMANGSRSTRCSRAVRRRWRKRRSLHRWRPRSPDRRRSPREQRGATSCGSSTVGPLIYRRSSASAAAVTPERDRRSGQVHGASRAHHLGPGQRALLWRQAHDGGRRAGPRRHADRAPRVDGRGGSHSRRRRGVTKPAGAGPLHLEAPYLAAPTGRGPEVLEDA